MFTQSAYPASRCINNNVSRTHYNMVTKSCLVELFPNSKMTQWAAGLRSLLAS